eukprot:55741_1
MSAQKSNDNILEYILQSGCYKLLSGFCRIYFEDSTSWFNGFYVPSSKSSYYRIIPVDIKLLILNKYIGTFCCSATKIDRTFKFCTIGDCTTGKTSIVKQFVLNTVSEWQESTIGAAFYRKTIDIPPYHHIKLEIWDTVGQERHRDFTPMYIIGAKLVLLVFDLCNVRSFEEAQYKYQKYKTCYDDDTIVYLVGNKLDLCHDGKRQVSTNKASIWAASNGMPYLKVSAYDAVSVERLFDDIAYKLCRWTIDHSLQSKRRTMQDDFDDGNESNNSCCGCCRIC